MVDIGSHIRRGHPIAFGLLAFISLVVGIIAATLTSDYGPAGDFGGDTFNDNGLVSRVHYMVFVGWWTFIFSVVYLALFLTGVGGVVTSIAGHGIWLFLTWIFWLAGAGAMSAILGGDCGGRSYYYCNSLRALEAFGWIGWILLTIMLVVVGVIGGGAFRGGRGLKDGLSEA